MLLHTLKFRYQDSNLLFSKGLIPLNVPLILSSMCTSSLIQVSYMDHLMNWGSLIRNLGSIYAKAQAFSAFSSNF
jgi:hypothetical protein